jgi:reactive chlorine resistance protein C
MLHAYKFMEELMPNDSARSAFDAVDLLSRTELPKRLMFAGRGLALAGVILPLFLIGILKFTQIEIDALKPLIGGTPWLAWLYPVFGEAGASYLLGTVELVTVMLFAASPWSARAGVAAGALGTLTFAVTVSTMFALPIWEESLGGFPWLNATGQFLIKDVALLGVSIIVLGEGLARLKQRRHPV